MRLFEVDQARKLCVAEGVPCHKNTIRKMIHRGQIFAIKTVGGIALIEERDLLQFIKQRKLEVAAKKKAA